MIQKFIYAVTCWLALHSISLPAVAETIQSQLEDIKQLETQFEGLRQFEEDTTCNNALNSATSAVYDPNKIEGDIGACRQHQKRFCGEQRPELQSWDSPGWNFHEIQTTIAACDIKEFRNQLKRRHQQYQQDLCYKNYEVLSQLENIHQLASRLNSDEKEILGKRLETQQVTDAKEFLRKMGLVTLEGESPRALQFAYEAFVIEQKIQQETNKFWITHTYGRSSYASFQWWAERLTLPDCPPKAP